MSRETETDAQIDDQVINMVDSVNEVANKNPLNAESIAATSRNIIDTNGSNPSNASFSFSFAHPIDSLSSDYQSFNDTSRLK